MMERPTCETCIHFKRLSPQSAIGQCRLSPKQVVDSNGITYFRFPEMVIDEGCGQHPKFPEYVHSLDPKDR